MRHTQNLVKFLSAFEEQCRIYLGGPDGMVCRRLTQPALTMMNACHPAPTLCSSCINSNVSFYIDNNVLLWLR